MKKKIAIFASGNGTNAENIIRTFAGGNRIEVTSVVCNVRDAGVMTKAASLNVPTIYISNQELRENPEELIAELERQGVNLIVLAGFMRKIPSAIVDAFPDAIINIHPSLLPKYGGKGMWGHHVHEVVVAAKETESGVTVHYVNNIMDGGRIIMQQKVDLQENETPETLEEKIHPIEYELYPRAIVAALENLDNSAKNKNFISKSLTESKNVKTTPPPTPDSAWAETLKINFVPPIQKNDSDTNKEEQTSHIVPETTPKYSFSQNQIQEKDKKMPPTHMALSVIMTILCSLIPGIIAIIYSSQVNSKYYSGDVEGAMKASHTAEIWIIVSFVLGVLSSTLYIPIMIATNMLSNSVVP